jgi:hypothetical protein
MRKIALVVVSAALLAGGCARPGPEHVSRPRLDPLDGAVQVLRDGEILDAAEPMELQPGDVVRTGSSGRALLRFPGAQSLEAAPDAELAVGGSGPELLAGSALVRTSTGLPVQVGDIAVRAQEAVYRLDRGVALRVGVYDGDVSLPGSGFGGEVSRLREAVVTAGIVARQPGPLSVDPGDAWDIRLLGEAIDLGLDLERLEAGLAQQLPARGARETLEAVLPQALSARRAIPVLRGIPTAGGMVASVVAARLAETHAINALAVLRRVVEELRLGASWAVVLAQWEVVREALVDAVSRISALVVRVLAPPPAASGGAPSSPGSSGGSVSGAGSTSSSTGSSTTTSTGGGSPGGDPPGGGDDDGGGTPPPPPECPDLVQCTVEGIIGDGDVDL